MVNLVFGEDLDAEDCKASCTSNKNCDGFSFHKGYPGSWQGTCYSTSSQLGNTNDSNVITYIKSNKLPIIGRTWNFSVNNPGVVNFVSQNNTILLHFNPRAYTIVLNTWTGGWQREEYLQYNTYPMNVTIKITEKGFEININNSISKLYNHRYNINTFDHIDTSYKFTDVAS